MIDTILKHYPDHAIIAEESGDDANTRIAPDPFTAVLPALAALGAVVYFLGTRSFCFYACPYGAALRWPDVPSGNARPQRVSGAHVILIDGGLVGTVDAIEVAPGGGAELVADFAEASAERGEIRLVDVGAAPIQNLGVISGEVLTNLRY